MQFKLGKAPARAGAVQLKFARYINYAALPKPPSSFGHTNMVRTPWGMLGNADYGCCVWAGAAHETMLWNAEAATPVRFTADSVLADYSAVTGFDKKRPETDQGTDMQKAASYRQKVGVVDADGKRHKIGAYLALDAGDVKEHLVACFLGSAVGVGVQFPDSAQQQFEDGHPWSVVPGARIDGGHYISMMGRRCEQSLMSTWGTFVPAEDPWLRKYNDESLVYFSEERLKNGRTIDGFNAAKLLDDLKQLGHPLAA